MSDWAIFREVEWNKKKGNHWKSWILTANLNRTEIFSQYFYNKIFCIDGQCELSFVLWVQKLYNHILAHSMLFCALQSIRSHVLHCGSIGILNVFAVSWSWKRNWKDKYYLLNNKEQKHPWKASRNEKKQLRHSNTRPKQTHVTFSVNGLNLADLQKNTTWIK